jgi:ERCC4-type nuclease
MLLSIDYRENKIIDLIKEESEDVNYKTENLNIGDFIIRSSPEKIEYIIERKSVSDLSASIIDNRFREQKARLLESMGECTRIVYIIEGNKKSVKNLPEKTINSAIINIMFKHKYKVIQTVNEKDTLDNIILLYKKVKDKEFEKEMVDNVFRSIKKSEKINENILENMLLVIPGVSINISKKIYEKYKTFSDLINCCEIELANVQITDKRKLGKALSKKIKNTIN